MLNTHTHTHSTIDTDLVGVTLETYPWANRPAVTIRADGVTVDAELVGPHWVVTYVTIGGVPDYSSAAECSTRALDARWARLADRCTALHHAMGPEGNRTWDADELQRIDARLAAEACHADMFADEVA